MPVNLYFVDPKETTFIIYVLVDPRSGEPRYVGKTERSLRIRMNHHLHRARVGAGQYVYRWMNSVLKEGKIPEVKILRYLESREELILAEKFYIRHLKELGFKLTNLTDGGEGAFGYKHTPESRALMSFLQTGKPRGKGKFKRSKEFKLQISRTKTGLTEDQQIQIVESYKNGKNARAVGRDFGVSDQCVFDLLNIFGVRSRTSRESKKKLTDEQELQVVNDYKSGLSGPILAKKYNISERRISAYLKYHGVTMRSAAAGRWLTTKSRKNLK